MDFKMDDKVMTESVKVTGESAQIINTGDEHYVEITTISKQKTITAETEATPDDFLAPGVAKELEITPEEKKGLAEALKDSGLLTVSKVKETIDFDEQIEHELNPDETIEYLMGKIYTGKQ